DEVHGARVYAADVECEAIQGADYAGSMPFADVYPLVATRALARPFTYEVTNGVGVGSVVAIAIHGARRRPVVVAVGGEPPAGTDPAPVHAVVDEVPPPLVELALWLADYYGTTPGRALALVAPERRSPRGERPRPGERESLPGEAPPRALTAAQRRSVDQIVEALRRRTPERLLLYGATGSGKTEVYLQASEAAIAAGRGVIVLVPEIALAPQTIGRLQARFGDRVAVLHSALTEAERRDERERIRSGDCPIVVGARSAVFAPVPDLGLICVDEEHDASYKQESD